MKKSIYVATSLDGYIARPDGELDWLSKAETGEDCGFSAFMKTVDCMIMGRNTYDKVVAMGQWPYGKTQVLVLTNRPMDIPENLAAYVRPYSGDPKEMVSMLAEKDFEHAYIDGGNVIEQFLKARLVDEMTITTIPVLIGSGIPLFGSSPLKEDIDWTLLSSRAYRGGIVQSRYRIGIAR